MLRSILVGLVLAFATGFSVTANAQAIFINEIHYDDSTAAGDTGEAIEIAGPAGTDGSTLSVVLYNGSSGASYDTDVFSGTIQNQNGGYGTLSISYPTNGIQNGSPDGIALVRNGTEVIQFLCYEGTLTATNGPANGMACTDIGVAETNATAPGTSLQLSGTGDDYSEFAWQPSATSSFGTVNAGQTFTGGAPAGTSFSINDVMVAEGNSGTTNFVFTVTKNGPDAASVSFATSDGTATQPADYATTSGTLSFAAATTTMTITVPVVGETSLEGNETFIVTLSAPTAGASLADASGTGTISNDDGSSTACGDPAILISAVQGSGAATTLSGTSVQIEGIVTGDFQGATALRGYFVQEEDAQADGNAATSEGIFVFEDAATPASVNVGDRVRVMGMAMEAFGQTVIGGPSAQVCATAQSLPALTDVMLPFAAADTAERFEGMRVRLPQNLFVTDNFTLGRFGEVVLSSGNRLVNPTQTNLPGGTGSARALAQTANDRNKILIDDGSETQNLDPIKYPGTGLTALNTLRGGDTVQNLTGVMSFGFSAYRIQPTVAPNFVAANPRTAMPPLPGAAGSFRVASFNVLNYFNGDGSGSDASFNTPEQRGADSLAEFNRQRDKIIPALLALKADVIGLIEIENDDFSASSAIANLVNGLNAAAPSGTTYAFVNPGVTKVGSDAIKVSFLYRTETTDLIGAARILDSAVANTPSFNSDRNRAVLAQTFKQKSSTLRFTAAVNHFKSKGSACSEDPDANDGQGNCADVRNEAAQALLNWLSTDPTASGDPDYLILGDLNAYAREDAIRTLEAAGYVNLAQRDLPAGETTVLSYPFDDQWGTLDYALANASLAPQVTAAAEWTINGAEPVSLDYNVEFKTPNQQNTLFNADAFRSSDHDPVVVEMASAACEAGSLSFRSAPYSVGEAAGPLTVIVQRTGGACGAASVTYATGTATGGTAATSGSDFTATSGTLNWADGDMADKSFTVAINNDTLDEADEVFGLGLSSATGAPLMGGGSTAATTATIADDDVAPVVAFSLANSQFAEDAGMVTVQLVLSQASGLDIVVPLSFGGTALRAAMTGDYAVSAGVDGMDRITFAAGTTTALVTLTLRDDALDESNETVELSMASGVLNATVGNPSIHVLTVNDNDSQPSVSLSLTGSPFAEEGGVATVTATLSAPSGQAVTVALSLGGTASSADYAASANSLMIPAGSTIASLTLTGQGDALVEGNETVVVSVTSAINASVGTSSSVTATISDNDVAPTPQPQPPTVTLAVSATTLTEANGSVLLTATLSAAATQPVTVSLGYAGTAAASDFTAPASLVIPVGATSASGAIASVDDGVAEPSETIVVSISALGASTTPGAVSSIMLTVVDDDAASNPSMNDIELRDVLNRPMLVQTSVGQFQRAERVSTPATAPAATGLMRYDNGFFAFDIVGLTPGAEAVITLTLPSNASPTRYLKCLRGACSTYGRAVIQGNVVRLTLVDGGDGDEDGIANGVIRDPGAPVTDVTPAQAGGGGGSTGTGLLSILVLMALLRRKLRL